MVYERGKEKREEAEVTGGLQLRRGQHSYTTRGGKSSKKKKKEYSQNDNKEKFVGTPHPFPDTDHPYNIIR